MHLENLLSMVTGQHRFMKDVLQLVTLEEQEVTRKKEGELCVDRKKNKMKHCTSVVKRLGYFSRNICPVQNMSFHCVAVPDRNRVLVHRIFQVHYQV